MLGLPPPRHISTLPCRSTSGPDASTMVAFDRLGVIATKVVHPGEPGQAVGCQAHRQDWGDRPDERSPECAADAARSTLVGGTHHAAGLDGGAGRASCRIVDQSRLPLAGALPLWWCGGAGGPQLGAAALQKPHLARAGRRDRASAPTAPERTDNCSTARHAGVDGWQGVASGSASWGVLEPKPPVVRYQRERPGELIHID